MQSQPNLSERASPTITASDRLIPIPHAAALCTLAFSITLGSTAASSDYMKRMNLKSASIASSTSTNTTSLQQHVSIVPPKTSWLEGTIEALLAEIPDEEWAKVPDIYVADMDNRM
jgi:hypothetical protein